MEKQMNEPMTKEEIIEKIKQWKKELSMLEKDKSSFSSMKIKDIDIKGLEYLKATDEMKRRMELMRLIKKYELILEKEMYKLGTEHFVEDLKNPEALPEFSWGIREKDKPDRDVIFEQHEEEYIKVTDYGKFEYLSGKSGVNIKDIPDSSNVSIEIQHFLQRLDNGRTLIKADDVKEAIANHPEYLGEKLNLLRITKGVEENQRDYFILSPLRKHQLADESIRNFFVNSYCSDVYLQSVVSGENGIYAGNIVKSEDGSCQIKYAKSSVRAAKLAELKQGSTELFINTTPGNGIKLPGGLETFKQIRNRFIAEIFTEKQMNIITKIIEKKGQDECQK